MIKKNILIHAINGIWLGHIKRTVLVAKSLNKLDWVWKIIFMSNSKDPFLIKNHWFQIETLDYWIEDTLKDISFDFYESHNYKKILSIIKKEEIQVIFHDTFFLKTLIVKHKEISHFLILRDSELSYLNSNKEFLYNFRKIYIPHIKKEISKEKRDFLKEYKNIVFTNYITQNYNKISNNEKKIIVSPWYWWDFENTIFFFKYISSLLQEDIFKDYEILFIVWKYYEKIKKELSLSKNIKVFSFIKDLDKEISKASIFIWRWWYNTVNEIANNKTKSLLFHVERFAESQDSRIDFFQKKLWLSFIKKWIYDYKTDKKNLDFLIKNKFENINSKNIFNGVDNLTLDFNKELAKKNILIFKNIFLPQSENFIFEEISSFENINPLIFTLSKQDNFFLRNNLEILYYKEFESLLNLEYPRILNLDLYKKFLKFLLLFIKKREIKVIYTEFLFDAYFIYKIKYLIPEIKIISAWRWFDVYSFLKNDFFKANKLLNFVDQVFVRDKNMKKELEKYKLKDNVKIIRSFTNIEKYDFKKNNFKKLDILFWARFVEKKGILEVLDLISLLERQDFIWEIWLIWDWELKDKILEKIKQLKLENRIKYFWFLEHKSFIKKLNQYNCYINYSRNSMKCDSEWINNIVIENIFSWNIIFSTLNWWLQEIITDRETWIVLNWNVKEDFEKIVSSFYKDDYNKIVYDSFKKTKNIFSKRNSIYKLEREILKYA